MIRIAISQAAFEAIAGTLPLAPGALDPGVREQDQRARRAAHLDWSDGGLTGCGAIVGHGELQRRDPQAGAGGRVKRTFEKWPEQFPR